MKRGGTARLISSLWFPSSFKNLEPHQPIGNHHEPISRVTVEFCKQLYRCITGAAGQTIIMGCLKYSINKISYHCTANTLWTLLDTTSA